MMLPKVVPSGMSLNAKDGFVGLVSTISAMPSPSESTVADDESKVNVVDCTPLPLWY